MGIIYLVQPAVLIGTNRFKIGCSSKSDLSRVSNGYRKGTRYLHIMECDDPFAVESVLKEEFNSKFNLIAGTEFFEGDEITIKRLFYKIYERVIYGIVEENEVLKQCVAENYCITEKCNVVKNNDVKTFVTKTNNNTFDCIRCGYITKRKYNLIMHLKRKKVCNPEILDIEREYLLEELEKKEPPKISKKLNKITTIISNNETQHKISNLFACSYCNKTFKHKNNMYRHEKHRCKLNPIKTQLINDNPLSCSKCNKVFKHKTSMYRHKKHYCKVISPEDIKNELKELRHIVSEIHKDSIENDKLLKHLTQKECTITDE